MCSWSTDDLKGSFSGVGIEFTIRQDTLRIQNVIKDGPADKAGLLAGDKVVSIMVNRLLVKMLQMRKLCIALRVQRIRR